MKKILILTLIVISSCQEKSIKNDAPLSGIIDQENEKTIIVEKLAQGYVNGKFEVAEEYFTEDGIHRVNDAEYSTEEIIAGYNFHSVLFDDIIAVPTHFIINTKSQKISKTMGLLDENQLRNLIRTK